MTIAPIVQPTTVSGWIEAGIVAVGESGELTFEIGLDWCLPGEVQVGFPVIARLVECVREAHWAGHCARRFVGRVAPTVRSIEMRFERPIVVGTTIHGSAGIVRVHAHSFDLQVELKDGAVTCASAQLRCVLLDPERRLVEAGPLGTS